MLAKALTPILNVSNIQESFEWFPPTVTCSGSAVEKRITSSVVALDGESRLVALGGARVDGCVVLRCLNSPRTSS
jgi:hypothetical protein